ncbi:MAG: undecaprenyldiphospho-muramoylpentapeptide beta-N-acetylglucosaminyltransferase [Bdellovibrio sp.]|nr:undecaprenyldiphospho-muramoylpentapeptide beta-N-acetylglucosaminyltransferase [Bdellovibrio sp.]
MNAARSPALLIAGGGTGGHAFAGLAVAHAWKEKFPDSKVIFVGAKGGIEEKTFTRKDIVLYFLQIGPLVDVGIIKKLKTFLLLPWALLVSLWILCKFRPQAILGVGGYCSGPVVLMAALISFFWRGKTALLEQNAVSGFTNKTLGRIVDIVFVAFPELAEQFSGKRVFVTGNPIRSEFRLLKQAVREPFVIFVFGGSQGAMGLNTLILESMPYLTDLFPKLSIIHQTGEKDYERIYKAYKNFNVSVRVEKFIFNMLECYEKASLVICRSGSSTLSELAAVGRASVLVPWPYHTDQQQLKNAKIFEAKGAAIIMEQLKTTEKDIAQKIRQLMFNYELLEKMEQAVQEFCHPGAQKNIVDHLYK